MSDILEIQLQNRDKKISDLEKENEQLKGYVEHKHSTCINFGFAGCVCGLDELLRNKS